MAGVIEFSRTMGVSWSASTARYEWVLELVAANSADEDLISEIRETIESNSGLFSVERLNERQRRDMIRILQEKAVPAMEDLIPEDAPYRGESVDHIRKLVALTV